MAEERNLVVVTATLPATVQKRLEIAEIVAEQLERRDIELFFRKFPVLFLECLQRHYPLTTEQIERYRDVWDWRTLMCNSNVAWTREIVDCFAGRFKWEDLDSRAAINHIAWVRPFLEGENSPQFWRYLSRFGHIFTPIIVWDYPDYVDYRALSSRKLNWDWEFIEAYKDRWDWDQLSENIWLPWGTSLGLDSIAQYRDRWNWQALSANPGLPWSRELLDQFQECWDWDVLSHAYGNAGFDDDGYRVPSSWKSTIDDLERYADHWNWSVLSGRKDLPWTVELIDSFVEEWDWECLSGNGALPWSIELIAKFSERWDWQSLSENETLPWSLPLIEQYSDFWSYRGHEPERGGLSQNAYLPWTNELIERFEDEWDWDYLSGNSGLPWSAELIDKYRALWWWGNDDATSNSRLQKRRDFSLSGNKGVPWSPELIERFAERWDWQRLSYNYAVTSVDAIVEKVAGRIVFKEVSSGAMTNWCESTLARHQERIEWRRFSRACSHSIMSRSLFRKFAEKLDVRLVAHRCSFGIEELDSSQIDLVIRDIVNLDEAQVELMLSEAESLGRFELEIMLHELGFGESSLASAASRSKLRNRLLTVTREERWATLNSYMKAAKLKRQSVLLKEWRQSGVIRK